MVRAISLFSGSLASIAATKLVMDEGVNVRLLHFRSPFFRDSNKTKEKARSIWTLPKGAMRTQSLKKDYVALTNISRNGGYSLKSCCTGCRTLMLHKALRFMKKVKADFIVTGEIVGARGLGIEDVLKITEAAGAQDLVLRPLSAKLLPPMLAERKGWVNRRHMKALHALDTHKLKKLAKKLGIELDGFSAEQRCKLTSPEFGRRLEDLLQEKEFNTNLLELLEFPLYYKIQPDVKIVLGLDDEQKKRLQNLLLPTDLRLYVPSRDGPMALVRAKWEHKTPAEIESIIESAAKITVTHWWRLQASQSSDGPSVLANGSSDFFKVQAHYRFENEPQTFHISVRPFTSEQELVKYSLTPVQAS